MALLPDGDTEPSIVGDTRQHIHGASSIHSPMGLRHLTTTPQAKGT